MNAIDALRTQAEALHCQCVINSDLVQVTAPDQMKFVAASEATPHALRVSSGGGGVVSMAASILELLDLGLEPCGCAACMSTKYKTN